eukprot:912032-Amphidinium_carterae.1
MDIDDVEAFTKEVEEIRNRRARRTDASKSASASTATKSKRKKAIPLLKKQQYTVEEMSQYLPQIVGCGISVEKT